jgi:ribosome-binding protein aMBF1 (putative translation factor)
MAKGQKGLMVRSVALDVSPREGAENLSAAQLEALGEIARMMRKRSGLTQTEVASRINCTQSLISQVEHGDAVTLETVNAIAAACGYNCVITYSKI